MLFSLLAQTFEQAQLHEPPLIFVKMLRTELTYKHCIYEV